jgi:hypothetical protein
VARFWCGRRVRVLDPPLLGDLIGAAGTAGLCVFCNYLRGRLRREIGYVGHRGVAGGGEFGPVVL